MKSQSVKHRTTYLNKNCDKLPQPEKYEVTWILVLEGRVMKVENMESHCICVSVFIA